MSGNSHNSEVDTKRQISAGKSKLLSEKIHPPVMLPMEISLLKLFVSRIFSLILKLACNKTRPCPGESFSDVPWPGWGDILLVFCFC
ncbi:MAG: hypothetical protein KDA68_21040, partial [Planctomycetaceae bacterium]|nr:hypothetical protein [Planctomycetaceae bacterium]